jgi:ABC-type branched-subunit amino acid transport system substrate-binding protein
MPRVRRERAAGMRALAATALVLARGSGGDGAAAGTGANSATGGTKAASCDGFENGTGITGDTITIANSSDISGPVPGIFESAQQATRALAAYFNASEDICGRKLEVLLLDSRADAGADQQAYQRACDEAFAAVGSQSAFDDGGAGTAPENAAAFQKAWARNGWTIDYVQGIDVSEFNHAPYVQQMKDKGIQLVNYTGPYQFTTKLQQAMAQQGFEPKVFLQDATIHDEGYVEEAGELGDGSYVYSQTNLFDDFSLAEMKLYRAWLDQVAPGATPNIYGVYAWSATRLFVEGATRLGGRLDRTTLIQALGEVRDWTANGMDVPQDVGAETTANCASIIQLNDGSWSKVSPGEFLCGSMSNVGG